MTFAEGNCHSIRIDTPRPVTTLHAHTPVYSIPSVPYTPMPICSTLSATHSSFSNNSATSSAPSIIRNHTLPTPVLSSLYSSISASFATSSAPSTICSSPSSAHSVPPAIYTVPTSVNTYVTSPSYQSQMPSFPTRSWAMSATFAKKNQINSQLKVCNGKLRPCRLL